jgi:predicted O-methyltransferase YrrM
MPKNQPKTLAERCSFLEQNLPSSNQELFAPFQLMEGHPWAFIAADPKTTYYQSLYGLAKCEGSNKILEIGSAFGMSAATLISARPNIEILISVDIGIYGQQYSEGINNIDFARKHLHDWCRSNGISDDRVRFYRADTQPRTKIFESNFSSDVMHWSLNSELMRLLQEHEFDLIFIDGQHTKDGLFNDIKTFWPFLKPGGLLVCDDFHEPVEYARKSDWDGNTWRSYHTFIDAYRDEILDSFYWDFPEVPPFNKMGKRPIGLIRKSLVQFPLACRPEFSMFDSQGAFKINFARQDHLASLGLDLAGKHVLEVGAGVGWHTKFFEKIGCDVITTDARPENVVETIRRYPNRKDRVAVVDLNVGGSHDYLGEFDVVYCYGTLYHLPDPGLCIRDMAARSRGLLLIETCVHPTDNGQINLAREDRSNPNQSFNGDGCRPGRDWVITELSKYFPYVYITRTQPDYPDFPLKWPAILKPGVQNCRAIFVASRTRLKNPELSELPLEINLRLEPVLERITPVGTNLIQQVTTDKLDCCPDSIESQELRNRLGIMLYRGGSVTENELRQAIVALAGIFASQSLENYISRNQVFIPKILLPLLLIYIEDASKIGNKRMVNLLQSIFNTIIGKRREKTIETAKKEIGAKKNQSLEVERQN